MVPVVPMMASFAADVSISNARARTVRASLGNFRARMGCVAHTSAALGDARNQARIRIGITGQFVYAEWSYSEHRAAHETRDAASEVKSTCLILFRRISVLI